MPTKTNRRNWTRLDKLFPVLVESPLFGFKNCIARNISAGGIFLETGEPLPLGSNIRIYFSLPQGAGGFSAEGRVKNHYFLNFGSNNGPASVTGMGVKFVDFDDNGENRLRSSLRQYIH